MRIALSSRMLTMLAVLVASAAAQPQSRSFHFEYKATLPEIPQGAERVDLWIPVPHNDPYQQIADLRIDSAHSYETATGPNGNTILHVGIDHPKENASPS